MLPPYTLALGKTEAVEKIMAFVKQQEQTKQYLLKKMEGRENFNIGDDTTYDVEREEKKKRGEQ